MATSFQKDSLIGWTRFRHGDFQCTVVTDGPLKIGPPANVDHDEFVRAQWMWERRPKSLLGKTLLDYLIAILIGFVLLLIPDAGILVACCWLSGMFLVIAQTVVRFVRWRHQYESSIARVIRSGAK
jgi:hypothetical protein